MDESLKHFLQEVLLLSSEVVEICSKLGAMRSILAFSNLDRMRQSIEKDENFSKLSVIDADLLLWVAKYVRHEKKLPTGDIDELMDLRETWKTEIQKAESESQLAALNEKLKILENDLAEKTQSDLDTRSKLETALKNHDSLKDKLNAEIKELKMSLAEKSGEIYTFKERLKETESNNAELRKVLKKFNGNGTVRLNRTPFAHSNSNSQN